jgi:hypothetical protein
MIEQQEDVKWEAFLRYRYIEIIALWEGRLTTNHIQGNFGVQRQQASKTINEYKKIAPDNLVYDQKLKGYTTGPDFKPRFMNGVVGEYLNLLNSQNLIEGSLEKMTVATTNTYVLQLPNRLVKPKIVRQLVRACERGQRLEIQYASMSTPKGEERVIAPHTLVNSGFRWHVRAYCEKSRDYRDFILDRILEVTDELGDRLEPAEHDTSWFETIDLQLIPNPELSEDQQELIRNEHCYGKDRRTITTKKATAHYLLQLLQVPTHRNRPAKEHPLILENLDQLKAERVLFG